MDTILSCELICLRERDIFRFHVLNVKCETCLASQSFLISNINLSTMFCSKRRKGPTICPVQLVLQTWIIQLQSDKIVFFFYLIRYVAWRTYITHKTYYRPQRKWAKVIFSQACVKNSVHRGGGCLPQCMLGYTPPPGSRLQHTVYERPVCILLECILVSQSREIYVFKENILMEFSFDLTAYCALLLVYLGVSNSFIWRETYHFLQNPKEWPSCLLCV